MRACIKKGYLYGEEGGTIFANYEEFAHDHVQDLDVALELVKSMLSGDGHSYNFAETDECFEVYTIIDRDELIRQVKLYDGTELESQIIKDRLEYLREELRNERISMGELVELQGLADYIDPGDVELLEAAGVPEHGVRDEDRIMLYADETMAEQAARLTALKNDPATVYFAADDHDRPDLPDWPLPADVWVWSTGDRWVATIAGFHADDWWEGSDDEDREGRPDPWYLPISERPTSGSLEYTDRGGNLVVVEAS
jgi:hypothetical protein